MKITKFLMLTAFSALAATTANTQCSDLFFSEYIDGSGNNKALEIYNPTNDTINLSNYKLLRYNNGSPGLTASFIMDGMLEPDSVYVVRNGGSVTAVLINAADTLTSFCSFSGNDVIALVNMSTNDTLDMIGTIGVDPGINGWQVGASTAALKTLVRKPNVHEGSTDWAVANLQWDVYPLQTFTYVGFHDMDACCSSVSSSQNIDLCFGESWMVGNNTYTSSGTYHDTLVAASGCDSVVTTNLAVAAAVNVGVTLNGSILSANATGAGYQWIDCGNGNAAINGATAATYTPTVTGDYAVVVTEGGCSDTSACTNVLISGTQNIKNTDVQWAAYPNPAQNSLYVNANLTGAFRLSLYNNIGQIIYTTETTHPLTEISVAELPAGTYFLRLDADNHQAVKAIVVE